MYPQLSRLKKKKKKIVTSIYNYNTSSFTEYNIFTSINNWNTSTVLSEKILSQSTTKSTITEDGHLKIL